MRPNGELSDQDCQKLREMHGHCLELAKACFNRLVVGSNNDGHANSWWRHYDLKIADIAKEIDSTARKFNNEA